LVQKVSPVSATSGHGRGETRTYLVSDRAATADKKLTESNQKVAASELALATARKQFQAALSAAVGLPKEVERLKTELQQVCPSLDSYHLTRLSTKRRCCNTDLFQANSAVSKIEDAHKVACRRVAGLKADLEHSEHIAHEHDMQYQAERDQSETEKAELSRRLRAAERRVTELEWRGRKRWSGPVIVLDDDDDE
jgi:chromosome segregation ATPase